MDSDSSSDSDDDFLTLGDKGKGNVDREALVRKKLLENFYGKTGSARESNAATSGDSLDVEDEDASPAQPGRGPPKRGQSVDATDLDSPYFDAEAHTSHHVINSSVHTLLEMDEQLTHQVRMQGTFIFVYFVFCFSCCIC